MKVATILSILVLAGLASAAEDNTDNFENNVRAILEDHSQVVTYITCLLDERARCSLEGRTFIAKIKDALETNCKNCTDGEREWTRTVIGRLINREPVYWQRLVDKYDPSRQFAPKYEEELKTVKA